MRVLEKKLGYTYKDRRLLATAITHSSYANENRGSGLLSNERLEFLGDSVLGMIVAEWLYQNYPRYPEGRMTRLRAELVCEQSLVKVAKELELGSYLRLGKGEEHSGGRERPSILADAVEAILASIYLDGGFLSARDFVSRFILKSLEGQSDGRISDYKTALQELVQKQGGQVLEYRLLSETGPDHNKKFTTEVLVNEVQIGKGDGRSKKESEQAAAKNALEDIDT